MCGRYSLTSPAESVVELFDLPTRPNLPARYNIAPTQDVPVVRPGAAGRELVSMRWGLIPSWAKDASLGAKMINARAETLIEKPAFRTAFRRRRCLVPADGFYEWQPVGHGPKQPYYIALAARAPFAFAGLWETWRTPEGDPLMSCTIVTCAPNALLGALHNRMPVILAKRDFDPWLDPSVAAEAVQGLLRPYPAEEMVATPVSTRVNNVRNDDASLIAPLAAF